MDNSGISAFLDQVSQWAEAQPDILAVLLVGSQASGNANSDSDVDLVLICVDPRPFLSETAWLHAFGAPASTAVEDWGAVRSIRAFYQNGPEVEFGITDQDWIQEPLDSGTKRIIDDGYRILVDKTNSLERIFA